MTERDFNLVVPLAQKATAMRNEDTNRQCAERSGAVSWPNNRPGDIDSTMVPLTPGIRTSTTATRTTTTRVPRSARSPSADWNEDAGFTLTELVMAYRDCRRTKRNTASALAFEVGLERNLTRLYDELIDGSYTPGRSICFVITRPKPREVWAAEFRDRVVHHLLYNRIGSRFERSFIADSCACIKGRGTLYAAQRLETKIRSITQNWSRPAYYLKCDLANFFVSINKTILLDLLLAKIREPFWRWLTELVLMHDPRTDFVYRGDPAMMELVPPHKRLMEQPAHLGLPIGNLSSQFFANVYLNALDQRAKHQLKAARYIRYVDDFLFLHESPDWLNAVLTDIDVFLPARLGVRLNPRKTILQPIDRGVDFVGQVIKPWRRSTRRRTVNEGLRRIASAPTSDVHVLANSYFGLLRQAPASHHDRTQLANVARDRGHIVNAHITNLSPIKAGIERDMTTPDQHITPDEPIEQECPKCGALCLVDDGSYVAIESIPMSAAAQPAVAPIADAASHVGASGVPEGFALVPIEPTEHMVVNGFESWPDPIFSKPEEWEAYEKLTGCQQAAHKARLCYAAMLAAAHQPSDSATAPAGAISADQWQSIQAAARDRGEFGIKPHEQVIAAIKDLATAKPADAAPVAERDMVTREQIIEWAKLAGIGAQTEKWLERLGDFAIFARAVLVTPDAEPSTVTNAKVVLTDERIIEALEAAGVQWQWVRSLAHDHKIMTFGSVEASKVIAGVRSLLAPAPVADSGASQQDEFGIDECIESLIDAKTLGEKFSARNQLDLAINRKIAAALQPPTAQAEAEPGDAQKWHDAYEAEHKRVQRLEALLVSEFGLGKARALLAAAKPVSMDSGSVMSGTELELFRRTDEQFGDCNETDTDYAMLMKWANQGLLECEHFTVTEAGRAALAEIERIDRAATTNTGADQ